MINFKTFNVFQNVKLRRNVPIMVVHVLETKNVRKNNLRLEVDVKDYCADVAQTAKSLLNVQHLVENVTENVLQVQVL